MNHPAAALVLLVAGQVAFAAPTSPRRSWELTQFTWIKRKPAEKGAPANGHPLRVDPAALARALGSVRFIAGAGEEALFAPAEAEALAKPLAEALSLAEPGEDLELLSTSKRDAGFFGKSLGVTARVFALDGRLNLIVHDSRMDFMDVYVQDFRMPSFVFGSRTAAGSVVLKAASAELRRPDWVVLPLTAAAATAPVVAQPPAVQPPAVQPLAIQPPATRPRPASTPSLEDRLKELKRFREQNLISEEEYAKKKAELLKNL